MKKRRIATLALSLLLLISGGCSLVDIDEEKAAEIENSKTIIEYNGAAISKGEISLDMIRYLSSLGTSVDSVKSNGEESWKSFLKMYVSEVAVNRIALDKAKELGLDQLTEEEKTTLNETYDSVMSTLDSMISTSAQSAVDKDPSLDYDTEYQKQLKNYLNYIGYEPETYLKTLENELIFNKVRDYFLKDIIVSEDEVRSYYNTQRDIQKNNIEISPDTFAWQQQLGSTILYYPDGYMNVRHILIQFDDETRSKALDAYSKGDDDAYNQFVETALSTIQPQIDEVVAKMESGDDFAALIDEYNQDTAMAYEPVRTDGQIVGPFSNISIPGYLDALTKLTEPGSYTLLNTYSGCYIIRCEKLLGGEVPYDDVKENLKQMLLSSQQETEWSTLTQGWIDEASNSGKLKMYPDRY